MIGSERKVGKGSGEGGGLLQRVNSRDVDRRKAGVGGEAPRETGPGVGVSDL